MREVGHHRVGRDSMTPLERLNAYGQSAPIDRLPCVPIVGNTAARVHRSQGFGDPAKRGASRQCPD